jgi:integrase/recombinase XerD
MKNTSLLRQFCPRSHKRFTSLPVLGGQASAFLQWLNQRGYSPSSLRHHLSGLCQLSRWLVRRRVGSLAALDQQLLTRAHESFLRRKPHVCGAITAIQSFLRQQGAIREGRASPLTASEVELTRFGDYLRECRGLAEGTILAHQRRLRPFLRFLRFDRHPGALTKLSVVQIESFLKRASRTNNRFSLQHVVAALRVFLKAKHAERAIARPLHQQIDTPRVYRLERLPRALPWAQVQALLASIDRSGSSGWRDFTMLYLAAAYGLRSGELVQLTLDDIDWRAATLRVPQSKTRRLLRLPLTDEAAKVLIDYLRRGRPVSMHRELFLRQYAPSGPLAATAVNDVLEKRARESGLKLPQQLGSHILRHSLAVHLLRRKAAVKAIGDTLGHRDPESTAVYLRLALEDLRDVGLPVPKRVARGQLLEASDCRLPRVRSGSGVRRTSSKFASGLRGPLHSYLGLKRALGRRFEVEAATLRDWDRFLYRRFRQARVIRPEMFHDWVAGLGHLTPTVRRSRMRIVRNFLLFHARQHSSTFIPDPLTFPKPAPARPPRLVSVPEMSKVLAVARKLGPTCCNPLRAQTARLAFILFFCCGLRRGELLRLKLRDVDPVERLLKIDGTKFHKSRLVPLSRSVFAELNGYLKQRRARDLATSPESFLIWSGRRPDPHAGYTAAGLTEIWQRLCLSAEVLDERGRPPRLHDLRHSFAVAALQRWYAKAVDVQAKLPHLAAYLGHVSPVSTHYYLHLTPELRAAASERFRQCFGRVLNAGGAE